MASSYLKKTEGVATLCGPFGSNIEVKTVTCGHCNRLMHVSPYGDGTADVELPEGSEHVLVNQAKREPPSVCHQCWQLICPQCHADGRCIPFIQKLEKIEAKEQFLRSAGIA